MTATQPRPLVSRVDGHWQRIKLQRYAFGSGRFELDNPSEHCMIFQLGGPALLNSKPVSDVRSERFWFGRGHMNLAPAGIRALLDLKGPSQLVLIRLDAHLLREVAKQAYDIDPLGIALRPCLSVADQKLWTLCDLLVTEAEKDSPGSGLMIESLARAMALQLLRRHSTAAPAEPNTFAPLAGARLRLVLDFMREHLDEPLHLARLAKVVGLSPSHFIRAFRKAAGESPYRYVLNLRIEKARELLEHTDISVIDVGMQCGFGQPSHFATMFKSRMGMSPRDWRSAYRF